ncbi:MAG TPA: sugar ABC transporter permease [Clostridiaceae bacterium]|jgi:multiple sugar transport system permease protein|nr:sugar ABC transporter permease [Clostridiaceae bacterium]
MINSNYRKLNQSVKESINGYIFILPALLIIGVFFINPAIKLFSLAYTDYNLMSGKGSFVGFDNFKRLLTNEDFLNSLSVTLRLAIFIVPVQTLIAMIMAVIINQKLKGINIFRTIYFIPAIVSFVAVAITWKQIYNPTFGLANTILGIFNLGPYQFLSSKSQALVSVAITCIWKSWGYFMVIFLSGLQDIPGEINEACKIDGANPVQKFFYITVPMLKKTTLFVVVITTMDAIKLFIPAFTMTGGGPLGSTDTTVHYIWRQAFRLQQVGPATAMSTVLFVIIVVITMIQLKLEGKND